MQGHHLEQSEEAMLGHHSITRWMTNRSRELKMDSIITPGEWAVAAINIRSPHSGHRVGGRRAKRLSNRTIRITERYSSQIYLAIANSDKAPRIWTPILRHQGLIIHQHIQDKMYSIRNHFRATATPGWRSRRSVPRKRHLRPLDMINKINKMGINNTIISHHTINIVTIGKRKKKSRSDRWPTIIRSRC